MPDEVRREFQEQYTRNIAKRKQEQEKATALREAEAREAAAKQTRDLNRRIARDREWLRDRLGTWPGNLDPDQAIAREREKTRELAARHEQTLSRERERTDQEIARKEQELARRRERLLEESERRLGQLEQAVVAGARENGTERVEQTLARIRERSTQHEAETRKRWEENIRRLSRSNPFSISLTTETSGSNMSDSINNRQPPTTPRNSGHPVHSFSRRPKTVPCLDVQVNGIRQVPAVQGLLFLDGSQTRMWWNVPYAIPHLLSSTGSTTAEGVAEWYVQVAPRIVSRYRGNLSYVRQKRLPRTRNLWRATLASQSWT